MGIFRKYVNQTRKPEGFMGKMMIKGMNVGHSKVADWGISHLQSMEPKAILEIGCGGGKNVAELLKKYPNAKVTAVDYSPLSVEKTEEVNAEMIKSGRCTVKEADVSNLNMGEKIFDLATAFETIYFWPEIDRCFVGICRILKPGGRFFIVNEAAIDTAPAHKWAETIDGMNVYEPHQIVEMLEAAGFEKVVCHEDVEKNRLCVEAFAPVG